MIAVAAAAAAAAAAAHPACMQCSASGHIPAAGSNEPYLLLFLEATPHNREQQDPQMMSNSSAVLDELNEAGDLQNGGAAQLNSATAP